MQSDCSVGRDMVDVMGNDASCASVCAVGACVGVVGEVGWGWEWGGGRWVAQDT